MENPNTWDFLTSHLAVTPLKNPQAAWALLVREKLIRNEAGDFETFRKLVQEEIDLGDITGPSVAARTAGRLRSAGLALPGSEKPDPYGDIAAKRKG